MMVIEDVAHKTGKIHDSKIHHCDPLANEVKLRLVFGRHAHRALELPQVEENAVLAAAAHIRKPEPALLVSKHEFAAIQLYADTHVAALARIKCAIDIGVAKYVTFNNAAAMVDHQQRRRHGAEALHKPKGEQRRPLDI